MMPMGIPAWNAQGVLPPVGRPDPTSAVRSPYVVPLSEVVHRFGTNSDRLSILDGLLRYRAALHATGLSQGFQWLNGSFVEDVERVEGRPPNDIDVVTFFRLSTGVTEAAVAQRVPDLFPQDHAGRVSFKQRFHVDAYLENLEASPERVIRRSTYWYSMWAHRRNGAWKGYVQVDLAPAADDGARALLASLTGSGAQP